MRKLSFLSLIMAVIMFSSCTAQEKIEVTEWTPAPTTEAPTETVTEEVKVKKMKIETDPIAKKKKKKETQPETEPSNLPTQGAVKPGRHIQVTTVKGSLSEKDFYFIYGSSTIMLNDTLEKLYEEVGEEDTIKVLNKKKTQYEYPDFVVTTYKDENQQERIEEIVVTEESWATAKGATVGYYGTALRRIYGDPVSNEKGIVTYTMGSNNLIFSVENNLVTGISFKYTH